MVVLCSPHDLLEGVLATVRISRMESLDTIIQVLQFPGVVQDLYRMYSINSVMASGMWVVRDFGMESRDFIHH